MDPIGASDTWHWEPYKNAFVTIDGKRMPSVPGGGHHGGGMFINAWDMARFGYLFLNYGKWNGTQLVPESWIAMAKTPGPANMNYGFMNWFLNIPNPKLGRRPLSATPASSVTFQGNGQNIVFIDWEHDLVVVVRWIRGGGALNEFLGKVIAALRDSAGTAVRPNRTPTGARRQPPPSAAKPASPSGTSRPGRAT